MQLRGSLMPFDAAPSTDAVLESIPDGPAGTDATLRRMVGLVREAKCNPLIRACAIQATEHLQAKDYPREARAIQAWVQANIRYVRDVRDVETLQNPATTLQLAAGDCDDQAMLVAAMLESIGHRARLVAVGDMPDDYSHVYCEVYIPRRGGANWYALETTEPWGFGQRPAGVACRMVRNI